jgi:hypothetical protein
MIMKPTITQVLYEWMLEQRIISNVAREMGVSCIKLSAELRPTHSTAKLGADDLVPVFRALRKLGYAPEARGILTYFIQDLKGETQIEPGELIPQLLSLYQLTGVLSSCASRLRESNAEEAELAKLDHLLKTRVLPVVLGIQCTVAKRRRDLHKKSSNGRITKKEVREAVASLISG